MSKMDCDIIRDLLPLYVDDVVSDATRQAVDDHLAGCPSCQQELVRLQRTLRLPLVQEAAPLRQLRRRWKQTKFRTALISILCTALLLGCLGWYFRPRPLAQAAGRRFAFRHPDHVLSLSEGGGVRDLLG